MNNWEQNLYKDICNTIKKEKSYEKIYWDAIYFNKNKSIKKIYYKKKNLK